MKTQDTVEKGECRMRETLGTSRAFSLVELLVVISIIVILAALTFPVVGAVKRAQTLHRARAELTQVETAIEHYNHKLGYYPPDNPLPSANWAINQLYYELLGSFFTNDAGVAYYQTLDGSARIINSAAAFTAAFGVGIPPVTGFMNCARPGSGDDTPGAVKFLNDLKPGQFLAITNGVSVTPVCSVLGTALDGPLVYEDGLGGRLNPWRYNSFSPHYNPKSFDLWVDIAVGSKTYRISNWSDKALIVTP
jgi:prepilin-type N-terminal cleavage/methylation domain-containing protein